MTFGYLLDLAKSAKKKTQPNVEQLQYALHFDSMLSKFCKCTLYIIFISL